MHVGEDTASELVQDGDGRAAGDVLREAREAEAKYPAQREPRDHGQYQDRVDSEPVRARNEAAIDGALDEPGPEEDGRHERELEGDHERHAVLHRAEQRDQP